MEQKNVISNDTYNRELSVSRLLNAPRELVWKVWTEPEHIAKWWGPNGFTNTIDKMEIKPGGIWDLIMHGPHGVDYKNKSEFIEIVKPEKISFRHLTGPKFTTTITFAEQGNKTLLQWVMVFDSAEEMERTVKQFKADKGLQQNVDKLEVYLSKM